MSTEAPHSGPARRRLVGTDPADLVTVVVTHTVHVDDEVAFLDWQRRLAAVEGRSPGHRGTELLRPVPGVQDDWVVVSRFGTAHDLEAWLASEDRAQLLDEGRRFRDFRLQRTTASFGSWFRADRTDAGAGPPSWKTAFSVLVGLYPTVVLLTLGLDAIWHSAPLWASLLVGNVLSVAALTWVVMPGITRALRFWLQPEPRAPQPRTDVLGVLAATAALAVAATVVWLVTT